MKKNDIKIKTMGLSIFFLLSLAIFAPISMGENESDGKVTMNLGTLAYFPESYDFGNMSEGGINTTTFEIWRAGGCCALEYALSWNCSWVEVFPTSGTSHGEHDVITVDINATGLELGYHVCEILIETNGGGSGVFAVGLNIIITAWPDLECNGAFNWTDVKPGANVTGSFTVANAGDPDSLLDWEMESCPDWGNWNFSQINGDNLKPEDGIVTVYVSVIAPKEKEKNYVGCVKIVNKDNSSDNCSIPISLSTPKNKVISHNLLWSQDFLDNHHHLFPLLRNLFLHYIENSFAKK